jgi:hypothetical protein
MTTTQKPTVGRIVHYQPLTEWPDSLKPSEPVTFAGVEIAHELDTEGRTGQPWPAIITEVIDDDTVRLDIRTPLSASPDPLERDPKWSRADAPTPGHWNWPPR